MLADLRIIEIGEGMAPQVAGLFLAELGADVLKIERPGGDPSRGSARFANWNRGKRSLVLDLDDPAARTLLNERLAAADVLIHQFKPSRAAELGLDDGSLRTKFPQLVVSGITGSPFGHPDVERSDDELLVAARTGALYENDGYRAGPIVYRYPLGRWGAACLCAGGVIARLLMRLQTGQGGPAHTSIMQGLLSQLPLLWGRNSRGPMPNPETYPPAPRARTEQLYECLGGDLLQIMDPTKRFDFALLPSMAELLGEGLDVDTEDGRAEAFKRRPIEVWLSELQAADLAVEQCFPLGKMLQHEEVVANGYVIEVDDPEFGRTTQPNVPFHANVPLPQGRPAPRLGEGGQEPWRGERVPLGSRQAPSMPLEGVRVVDFGMFLAGPMATSLMGDLGADVIKVEPLTGDRLRFLHRHYQAAARSKRSLALDLTKPEAQPILERLVGWAELVHHNMRFKGAAKLGLSEDNLRIINPSLTFSYVSAYGQRGNRTNWPGLDTIFTAMAGWEYENAGAGNLPIFIRQGPMDVLSAQTCFVASMAALYAQRAHGAGITAQSSLLGAAALTQSELLIREDGTLTEIDRLDSEQTGLSPYHRIFQASDDEWVAVAATTSATQAALHQLLGPDPATFADVARRMDSGAFLTELESRRIPCDLVASTDAMNRFFDNPVNLEHGLVWALENPLYGVVEQPGAFWNFVDTPMKPRFACPDIGEHSEEILLERGFHEKEIRLFKQKNLVK